MSQKGVGINFMPDILNRQGGISARTPYGRMCM